MVQPNITLRQLLEGGDPERRKVFAALDRSIGSLAANENSAQYSYPSASQALEAFKRTRELATSGTVNNATIGGHLDELAVGMRLWCYEKGKVPGLLRIFRWEKGSAILDLSRSLQATLVSDKPLSFFVLIRPILEQVAATAICTAELTDLLDAPANDPEGKHKSIVEADVIVSRRGKGTRIDWQNYLTKSLRAGKKKSYKPDPDSVDLTATDLMNTIDRLDKRIKGARKAYEFASEFAHPNIGSHLLFVASTEEAYLADGVKLWTRYYTRDTPEYALAGLRGQFLELLEIVSEAIDLAQEDFAAMRRHELKLKKRVKEVIRICIKRNPFLFHLDEPCPCFSGSSFGTCCGKKTRAIHKQRLA